MSNMFFLAVILIICGVSEASIFKVGDANGWTSIGHVDYKSWAASKHFQVGDTIMFEYNKQFHNVVRVTHKNYQMCNATAPYGIWTSGNDSFTISKPGHYFFISGFSDHCKAGQRVDIRVPHTPVPKAPSPTHGVAPKASPVQSPTPARGAPKASPHQSPTPASRVAPKAAPVQSPTHAIGVAPKAAPVQSPTPAIGVAPKAVPAQSPTHASGVAPKASPQQSPTPVVAPKASSPQSSPPPSSVAPIAAPLLSPPAPTETAPVSSVVPSDQPLAPTPAPEPSAKSSATRSWTKKYLFLVAACVSIFCF